MVRAAALLDANQQAEQQCRHGQDETSHVIAGLGKGNGRRHGGNADVAGGAMLYQGQAYRFADLEASPAVLHPVVAQLVARLGAIGQQGRLWFDVQDAQRVAAKALGMQGQVIVQRGPQRAVLVCQ